MRRCSSCRQLVLGEVAERLVSREIAGVTISQSVPCLVCSHCGEAEFDFRDLAAVDKALAERLIADGHDSAEARDFIRKVVGS